MKRSKGKTATGALAYDFRENIKNEHTGKTHRFARKKGDLVFADILLPAYAPERFNDPATFANALEQRETHKNAQVARRIFFALPRELMHEQHIALTRDIVQTSYVSRGMCASVAIHDKGSDNPHAHILLSMRKLRPDGTFGNKCRQWNEWGLAKEWLLTYQDSTNQHLELAGSDARIDVRSYRERGIDKEPTIHLGPCAHYLEQNGKRSQRGDRNREIEARNRLRAARKQKTALLLEARELEMGHNALDCLQHRLLQAASRQLAKQLTQVMDRQQGICEHVVCQLAEKMEQDPEFSPRSAECERNDTCAARTQYDKKNRHRRAGRLQQAARRPAWLGLQEQVEQGIWPIYTQHAQPQYELHEKWDLEAPTTTTRAQRHEPPERPGRVWEPSLPQSHVRPMQPAARTFTIRALLEQAQAPDHLRLVCEREQRHERRTAPSSDEPVLKRSHEPSWARQEQNEPTRATGRTFNIRALLEPPQPPEPLCMHARPEQRTRSQGQQRERSP